MSSCTKARRNQTNIYRTKIQIGQISFSFVLPSSSLRDSVEPDDAPIKKEEEASLQSSHLDAASPTTTKSETRSPSMTGRDERFLPERLNLSEDIKQEPNKNEAKPLQKSTKRQSTRREYLPEEIPPEYREKPQYSYSHLIATALRAHPEASGISLSEIYKSIQDIFPFYKYCPHGWQNSVRHNLSSNKAFRKISKEGKGWLWGIDEEYFQERERLKRKAAANSMKAKEASAAAAKAKHIQQQEKEQQQQLEHDQLQYQTYTNQAQYQLHNQQFQAQLQQQAVKEQQRHQLGFNGHNPLNLPEAATFIPRYQPQDDVPVNEDSTEDHPMEIQQFSDEKQDGNSEAPIDGSDEVKITSPPQESTSPSQLFTAPIKKERAKTIAELASEIQIDSRNDRLYYSNMTRESYAERKRLNSDSEAAPAAGTPSTSKSQSPPVTSATLFNSPHLLAVATNSIAQNDAILNSPRYQQYYNSTSVTPGMRVTPTLPGFTTRDSLAALPAAAKSLGPVQSMAAGQNTFRMTQAPKLSGPATQATQSQLQKQTSVPQMRVNPQVPQGVRDKSAVGAATSPDVETSASPQGWTTQQKQGNLLSTPVSASRSTSPAAAPAAKPAAKANVNANLANLNLPKDTLRVINLLQEKIKAQMQSSGQPINSTVLTNALAIAITQLTKNSGSSGGGAAALSNLLKGKNQSQLISALATAISSAKKPGSASKASSRAGSPHGAASPSQSRSSTAVPSPGPSGRSSSPAEHFKSPAPKPVSMPAMPKLHPPVNVPAAISSPASLSAGSLPAHLSSIANFGMPRVAQNNVETTKWSPPPVPVPALMSPQQQSSSSPAPKASLPPVTQSDAVPKTASPAPVDPTPVTTLPEVMEVPAPVSSTTASKPSSSTSTTASPGPSTPAPAATSAAKSKAEMISEMLAKASKLTNPSPSIRAALAQLQAHATKLGLKIPDNLKNLDVTAPTAPKSSSSSTLGNKRTAETIEAEDESKPKIQKTE